MSFQEQLNHVRKGIGPLLPLVGRNWGKVQSRDLIPQWAHSNDPLVGFWKDQLNLLRSGKVVWACMIQANPRLFTPGKQTLPGEVVTGQATDLENDPEPLQLCASRVFQLKGTKPEDRELREVAERITDELHRSLGEKLPTQITDGRTLTRYTVFFHQPHLPHGLLNGKLLPLLTLSSSKYAMVVPHWYWPDELLSEWEPTQDQLDYFHAKEQERMQGPLAHVTPEAVQKLRELIAQSQEPGETLYVRLENSDSSIKLYLEPNKTVNDLEDTFEDIPIVIDKEYEYECRGCTIDFVVYGERSGFSITK